MSIAGIRSSRGDGYQTLVAMDWAVSMLGSPEYAWLEIDSSVFAVDDVVIGKADGSLICCQCKKNQTDFESWTVADLRVDLEKASSLLATNPDAEVRFYSRSPFGALAKLREHCLTHSSAQSYYTNLSKRHQQADALLKSVFASDASSLSTFEFLTRTTFEVSSELTSLQESLHKRLRQLVTNEMAAYDALWALLDQLGGRLLGGRLNAGIRYRISERDLQNALVEAGAMMAPATSNSEVRESFARTSSIGRSWHREIAGHRIANPTLAELLNAIDSGNRSILLTGPPGSGKTCVILSLQDVLEQRASGASGVVPLFIQSREFADLGSAQARQEFGLAEKWVENAARLAESSKVVVVIDSLDVLSIAREHTILSYFLAQIDRLLHVSNITVVTACRDFDRQYDRRIAERTWDCELKCLPLTWETQVAPLLTKLNIKLDSVDTSTRQLICNPRELALFVELAQRDGAFSVVTSQALAQRFLEVFVSTDSKLGNPAILAIEDAAMEMLRTRSLSIPTQRFGASENTRRLLCSLNILQQTSPSKLTFGHQTLLDVLAISATIRKGTTLAEFIHSLPPVPFVRPSIRSFISQLALGERASFRKQLRAVLTGPFAFHIRRLVAESFTEQPPQDGDWHLIRDLRSGHREIYQAVYASASRFEWHEFWLSYLVPVLKGERDSQGLIAHAHHMARWKNQDAAGVLQFWREVISMDWVDGKQLAWQLPHYLSELDSTNLQAAAPLLRQLVNLPRQKHSFIGEPLARLVQAGFLEDEVLWQFIAGDVTNDDARSYHFNNKLQCEPHEFGKSGNDFLKRRVAESTTLLELALSSVEGWSAIISEGSSDCDLDFRNNFLDQSSYSDNHSEHDFQHVSGVRVLFDALESSIVSHSMRDSEWWQRNSTRICFSAEGALRYLGILACISSPETNSILVARVLCQPGIWRTALDYELGNLVSTAFVYLNDSQQDAVTNNILATWAEELAEPSPPRWIYRARASLIAAIPCHLRSANAQNELDTFERKEGKLIRQPAIMQRGGMVSAPFSFSVFLSSSDTCVLRLLLHYSNYTSNFDDFLLGGEREVGIQLHEAASRHPTRFLRFLSTSWIDLSEQFRDDILSGAATHLEYRHGNLQPGAGWESTDQIDGINLASLLLDEMERHPVHWHQTRAASKAIRACANVIQEPEHILRLAFLAIGYVALREESSIRGDSVDLVTTGINMKKGNVAEALMILATALQKSGSELPAEISSTLRRFCTDEHPAIQALILRRLPALQSRSTEFGWELFALAMQTPAGLWRHAEPCLYYAYHNSFPTVRSWLARLWTEGVGKDLEVWGRISALAVLASHIDNSKLISDLIARNSPEAWEGAASVWSHHENFKQHKEVCSAGIRAGLRSEGPHSLTVARKTMHLFNSNLAAVPISLDLIQDCFTTLENDDDNHRQFGFPEWVNATAQHDPQHALAALEIYLSFSRKPGQHYYDHHNNLTQLLTRLYSAAEELEASDGGRMLHRVVSSQDQLLALGLSSIGDWLKAAERP